MFFAFGLIHSCEKFVFNTLFDLLQYYVLYDQRCSLVFCWLK